MFRNLSAVSWADLPTFSAIIFYRSIFCPNLYGLIAFVFFLVALTTAVAVFIAVLVV